MDFTVSVYHSLLLSLIDQGYQFQTLAEFLQTPKIKSIILRHDVEAKYYNALTFAKIQHDYDVKATYYFRFLPNHFRTDIIEKIAELDHDIGYHYDDLSHCNGDFEKAILRFDKNLNILRKIAPVKTICMEGAPLSKYDNRDLWKKYNYRDFGIIGEPYFDIDFSQVMYLTDTGRRWDGGKYSVRDKVGQLDSWQLDSQRSETWNLKPETRNLKLKFHSTKDIITAAQAQMLPDQIMFTFHPQRWSDKPLPWAKELVMQNVKNVVKRIVLSVKG